MKDKIVDEGYARLRKNMKYHVLDEFTYDIKIPGESKSLSEKFKICGDCAYFDKGACIHSNSRDNCGDSDSDRKCYHNGFASVPYNWDSYTCDEKEKFRLHKTIKRIKC